MKLLYNKHDVYKETYNVYQYNNDYIRICLNKYCRQKGFENSNYIDYIGSSVCDEILQFESERVSLSRTKRNIREICLCNDFEYFATITINSKNADRYSLDECQNLLHKKLKKLKRQNKNFAYIFITEKHKDNAFHFHGLVKSLSLYENKNHFFSNKVFDEIGYNSFSFIKDYNKCCNYITKYITKDCVKNSHNQIYFCSRGLRRALKYQIKPISLDNWGFENDFCKIKDFYISQCSSDELLKILQIKEEI